MALFRRNITGDDLLVLWRHVARNEPTPRNDLLTRFYPGDADDPEQSDARKTLSDAIDFLIEADQFRQTPDGYVITDQYRDIGSIRVAILQGLRTQGGEDAAYMDVLKALTDNDWRYFDHSGELEDLVSDYRDAVTWNETRLRYWRRTMDALGVVRTVNTDEDLTTILSLEHDLLQELLASVVDPDTPAQLKSVLGELHRKYIPVFVGKNETSLASYVRRALQHATATGTVTLSQDSDFGDTITINNAGYNSIILHEA